MAWAEDGHKVHAVDVSAPFIELAESRAREAGLAIEFAVDSATELPFEDHSMDVCLAPELLEHVVDWERCLDEFCRLLRSSGLLYVSTSNALCPIQNEFDLPLYSWYPGWLKRRYERLAVSTRPEIVNHAKYPAVNWFTPYQLRAELARRGLIALDRFDLIDVSAKAAPQRAVVASLRAVPALRFIGHVLTPYTVVLGIK
jgi:SAM-dependent methyltransferase